MDYYFSGKELLINEVSFLSQAYCEDYDFYNFNKINTYLKCQNADIDCEILYSKNLMVNNLPSKSATSFYFNIYTENTCDIVMLFDISAASKLWINGEILVSDEDVVKGMYCRKFNKGKNTIYGEFFANEMKSILFVCRVSSLESETKHEYCNITKSRNLFTIGLIKPLNMWDQETFFYQKEYVDCLFIRDYTKYSVNDPIDVRIFYRDRICPIDELSIYFNEKYSFDLIKYRKGLPDGLFDIVVEYNFTKKDRTRETVYKALLIKDFILEIEKLIPADNNVIDNLTYERIDELKDFPQTLYLIYLDTIKSKNILGGKYNIYGDNIKRHYYRSELDGGCVKYHVRIPYNYDPNKEYPLILCPSTVNNSDFSYFIDYDDIILGDVSGRGVTGGSYIGEAYILEGLKEIRKRYNINKSRIYLLGFSNGSYAATNLLLHYPHVFAGAYAMSGRGDGSLACNIINKVYFNIYSSYDGAGNKPCLSPEIDENMAVDCPMLNHNLLLYYSAQESALKKILSVECEEYPVHIHAKTYSMYHRKFYWFEFLDITFSKKYAEADVIVTDNNIKISIVNSDKFVLDIPPYLSGKPLKININGSVNNFQPSNADRLCFKKSANKFILSKDHSVVDPNKGRGLLCMYYKPLKIYTTNDEFLPIAENFSRPSTNGFVHEIFTDYAILSLNDFDKNSNSVIIDNPIDDSKEDSDILNMLSDFLIVKIEKDGFSYKGEKYIGEYCIMQIFPNPENFDLNILYIAANDISLIKKNLLLRKIIIPFDSNGINPYWNNEVLIFYNDRYYRIYEKNGDMELCKSS